MGEQLNTNAVQPSRWRIYRRQLFFVLYSMVAGALFANLAIYRVMYGFGGDWIGGITFSALVGGTVGFILSPVFVGFLYRKPIGMVFCTVVAPTGLVSLLFDHPIAGMLFPILCFLLGRV